MYVHTLHSKAGYETKVGGNDEKVSTIAVSRRYVAKSSKESEDGTRVAATRKRYNNHRAASAYICL